MRRRCGAFALVLVLVVLGGCGVLKSSRQEPGPAPGSMLSGLGGSVDFRSMPTREQVGMGSDGFVTYPRRSGGHPVPTTLVFPTGTVHRDFFSIDIGANFAFAPDSDPRHQPTDFDFYLKAANLEQARSMLREDGAALGLSAEKIADITSQGTSVEQGSVHGWLSTEIEVRAGSEGTLNLIYMVGIGKYHNEALDKILHDGKVGLDLRTRPTAADLGFLDVYDSADVNPEPHQQLSVTLRTPTGRTTLPTDSMFSNRSNGTPGVTILLGVITLPEAPRILRPAATALGFELEPALDLIKAAGPDLRTSNLPCSATDVYTCALRLQTSTDGSLEGSLAYRLTLTYR